LNDYLGSAIYTELPNAEHRHAAVAAAATLGVSFPDIAISA
jgi:hypothetical protein